MTDFTTLIAPFAPRRRLAARLPGGGAAGTAGHPGRRAASPWAAPWRSGPAPTTTTRPDRRRPEPAWRPPLRVLPGAAGAEGVGRSSCCTAPISPGAAGRRRRTAARAFRRFSCAATIRCISSISHVAAERARAPSPSRSSRSPSIRCSSTKFGSASGRTTSTMSSSIVSRSPWISCFAPARRTPDPTTPV